MILRERSNDLFCIAAKIRLLYKAKCLNGLVLYFISYLQCEHHLYELVSVEVLRRNQPNGVMSSAASLPDSTFTGQGKSSRRLTSIVHIL